MKLLIGVGNVVGLYFLMLEKIQVGGWSCYFDQPPCVLRIMIRLFE